MLIVIQEWRGGYRPEYDLFDQHWRQLGVARRPAAKGLKKILDERCSEARVRPGAWGPPGRIREGQGSTSEGGGRHDEAGARVAEIRTISDDTPLPVPDGTEGYYLKTNHPLPEPLRTVVIACTIVLQSVVTSESADASFSVTFPGIPALFDRLRRRSRS